MYKKFQLNTNQLSIPFANATARTLPIDRRQNIFWSLVSISFISLALYVYAINATAHHLAVRQNLERHVAELNAEIASLEFTHIQARNSITIDTAREYGFQEVKTPLYVTRSESASALTLNTVKR